MLCLWDNFRIIKEIKTLTFKMLCKLDYNAVIIFRVTVTFPWGNFRRIKEIKNLTINCSMILIFL